MLHHYYNFTVTIYNHTNSLVIFFASAGNSGIHNNNNRVNIIIYDYTNKLLSCLSSIDNSLFVLLLLSVYVTPPPDIVKILSTYQWKYRNIIINSWLSSKYD